MSYTLLPQFNHCQYDHKTLQRTQHFTLIAPTVQNKPQPPCLFIKLSSSRHKRHNKEVSRTVSKIIFTARCTLVQSAVLRSFRILSVPLSVC